MYFIGASEVVCFGGLYQPRFLSFIVSISARYFMHLSLQFFNADQVKDLETQKSTLMSVNVRGERRLLQITKAMIDEFEIELSEQCESLHQIFIQARQDRFFALDAKLVPKSLPVLFIHGTADKMLDYRHSLAYCSGVPSATLVLVQDADHVFSKPFDTALFQHVKQYIIEKTIFRPAIAKM